MRGAAMVLLMTVGAQAQAQMTRIAAAREKANPEWNKGNLAGVRPLRDHLVGAQTRSWILMLLGAVTCYGIAFGAIQHLPQMVPGLADVKAEVGTALKDLKPADDTKGVLFDGRLAEDFKLTTGTWVHVGGLRVGVLAA